MKLKFFLLLALAAPLCAQSFHVPTVLLPAVEQALPATPSGAIVVGQPLIDLWWTQPSGTPISWNVYSGTATGVCTYVNGVKPTPLANVTVLPTQANPFVDLNVTRGTTYFLAVSAVYSGGGESSCTPELQLPVPGASPAPGMPQGSTQ